MRGEKNITDMRNKYNLSILLFITGLILAVGAWTILQQRELLTAANAGFRINHASGFYAQDLSLELDFPRKAQVYYTEDGTEPSKEAIGAVKYEEPIVLPCGNELTVYTLKFILYLHEEASPVYTYTYFVGPQIAERFDTLVVSITGDEEELFGDDRGIFVEGKLRREFVEAHPELEEIRVKDPANYNLRGKDGEREVTVQMFNAEGQSLLNQNCGIRISGNYTRGKVQKSFQLFPRRSYDEYGTFHTALFPDTVRKSDGTILDRHNRLLFRNSGDDFNHGFIRDTLIQTLAQEYGYPFAYTDRPAAVYINGCYQGFYWMREPFQNGLLENLYGHTGGSFAVLELDEYHTTVVEEAIEERQQELQEYAEEYQDLYDFFCEAELSDDKVYEELNKQIDVENYLQYYALQLYIGNKDWPYNNVKAYRYVSDTDVYQEGTIFDGRYRYLLFDTDYSFHLEDQYISYAYDEDNIAILSNNGQSPIFSKLMGRKDCRDYFVNTLCDLMNSSFAGDHVIEVMETLEQKREKELACFLTEGTQADALVTMESVDQEMQKIQEFATHRPEYVHSFIETDFPVFTPYQLVVKKPETVKVSVNTIPQISDGFMGEYYGECGLTIVAEADVGHSNPSFVVNGKRLEGSVLHLSAEELLNLLDGRDCLEVNVEVEDTAENVPVIYQISPKGSNDQIVFYNPTDHDISLQGYYLSDDPEELMKSALPNVTLTSGETYTLYGVKNQSEEAKGQSRVHFNLKKDETLFLLDEAGQIVQSVLIPDLQNESSVYQLDLFKQNYYEVLTVPNGSE